MHLRTPVPRLLCFGPQAAPLPRSLRSARLPRACEVSLPSYQRAAKREGEELIHAALFCRPTIPRLHNIHHLGQLARESGCSVASRYRLSVADGGSSQLDSIAGPPPKPLGK